MKVDPVFQDLPQGVEVVDAGETESNQELIVSFVTGLILALLMMYAFTFIQFKSFLQPSGWRCEPSGSLRFPAGRV